MLLEKPWALLADGMGGHDAGEVASEIALSTIADGLPRVGTEADVARLLDAANLKVFEAMYFGAGRPAMGTTVVGAVLIDRRMLVFNLGDSRAYSFTSGRLTQVSLDHSVGALGTGRRKSPLLTQSLGGTISRRPLAPAMSWMDAAKTPTLLLCSDGLTDAVQDEEIAALLSRHPDDPATALIEAALDAGGRDNITAIVVGGR
jgi:protein phosphatase